MFEITGVMPEPIVDEKRRLGRTKKMTRLYWKSDAAAPVVRRLPKGNGLSA
jgi:hypothetical protein